MHANGIAMYMIRNHENQIQSTTPYFECSYTTLLLASSYIAIIT